MKNFNEDNIGETLATIRAKFEKPNNETGLEIIDSYEDQFASTGILSDRQITWMDKQLDGSWYRAEKQSTDKPVPRSDIQNHEKEHSAVPTQGIDQLFDGMIRQKLANEGKALVDLAGLKELTRAIDDVRDLLKSLQ